MRIIPYSSYLYWEDSNHQTIKKIDKTYQVNSSCILFLQQNYLNVENTSKELMHYDKS